MGEVIRLADRRERPRSGAIGSGEAVTAEFFFDLASPFTYLAAERVERAFDVVTWSPASARTLRCRSLATDAAALEAVVERAEERAGALRLPLAWPERWPAPVPTAMRVAHHAAQQGRGGAFVLAATRLAFAGGFDLDEREILSEAAAAAGLPLDACLRAAREERRDGAIEAAARISSGLRVSAGRWRRSPRRARERCGGRPSGVRVTTSSGSSRVPAACARSSTSSWIVSPESSRRRPEGSVGHCSSSRFGRAVARWKCCRAPRRGSVRTSSTQS
jgi:2-hydroxychromene-2-carboxylate isomerase